MHLLYVSPNHARSLLIREALLCGYVLSPCIVYPSICLCMIPTTYKLSRSTTVSIACNQSTSICRAHMPTMALKHIFGEYRTWLTLPIAPLFLQCRYSVIVGSTACGHSLHIGSYTSMLLKTLPYFTEAIGQITISPKGFLCYWRLVCLLLCMACIVKSSRQWTRVRKRQPLMRIHTSQGLWRGQLDLWSSV